MLKETFKFSPDLVPLVVSGEKDCTWRLWDDKNLKEGDEVILIARPELKTFGEAVITSVTKKIIGELTNEDKTGHEPFESDEQMYATYTGYYGKTVDASTPVTIYRLRLTRVLRGVTWYEV